MEQKFKVISLEELDKHEGEKVTIAGIEFKFNGIWGDNSGTYASFSQVENGEDDSSYFIYATPLWEGHSVPVQVETMDTHWIDVDDFDGDVESWEDYVKIVKVLAEAIIVKREMGMKK